MPDNSSGMSKKLSLICAMSQNHVIGIKNDLPWHLPQDLEHFKNLTKGKPIIMGRLTYQSILDRRNGKPLPHRPHYVVTRQNLGELPDGVVSCPDLEKAIEQAHQDHPESEVMIIGGASIYEQSISLVDRMYLTVIKSDVEGDAFFPHYNQSEWFESDVELYETPVSFKFLKLDKIH